jgi:hypothetical protein
MPQPDRNSGQVAPGDDVGARHRAKLLWPADAGELHEVAHCVLVGGLGRSAVEWFRTGVEVARWEPSFSWVITQGMV